MDPTIKVAKEFPDKHFVHVTGYKRSDNVATSILVSRGKVYSRCGCWFDDKKQ